MAINNLPEYVVASLGGSRGQLIRSTPRRAGLAFQLKDAGARCLLTILQFLDKALAAVNETGIPEFFVFGEAEEATPCAAPPKDNGPSLSSSIRPMAGSGR